MTFRDALDVAEGVLVGRVEVATVEVAVVVDVLMVEVVGGGTTAVEVVVGENVGEGGPALVVGRC